MKTTHCEKCGFDWIPRIDNPKMCPKCKSYSWWIKVPDNKIGKKHGLVENP